jgi:hypothetical protein
MNYKLRISQPQNLLKHHVSESRDKLVRQRTEQHRQDIDDAVEYCIMNDCKGYTALSSGLFPRIKDAQTINWRLPDQGATSIVRGQEKAY